MKVFYVPIYIRTSVYADEKICLGMIYVANERVQFDYTDKKLQWAVQYTKGQSSGTVKRYLRQIEKIVHQVNNDHSLLHPLQDQLQPAFYEKLSQLKANYIVFGKVHYLDDARESWKMEQLYKKVVGTPVTKNKKGKNKAGFRKRSHQIMQKRAFAVFEKNYVFHPDELPGIYTRHKIDLVLLQSKIMGIQFIDFSVQVDTIEKNIIHFSRIVRGLRAYAQRHNIPVGQFYIAHQMPKGREQKALFNRINQDAQKQFEPVRLQEVHRVV